MISNKILSNFDKWKGSTLFMVSRLSLINLVIYGSFFHSFMVYKWPIQLLKNLEKCIKNFLWNGDVKAKKLISVKWDLCCDPLDEGGVGLKKLSLLNKALLSKLAWRVSCDPNFVFFSIRS